MNREDIERFSHIFDNTTSTYKFYWMLSILDVANEGRVHGAIGFDELVARMISKAWWPLKHGFFSFGECDALIKRIDLLILCSPLNMASMEDRIRQYLINNRNAKLVQQIVKDMTKYVPYRLLYPWIGACKNSEAVAMSKSTNIRALYSIVENTIVINPCWRSFLVDYNYILKGFTLNHLYRFLERKNPDFCLPDSDELLKTANSLSCMGMDVRSDTLDGFIAADKLRRIRKISINHINFMGNIDSHGGTITGNINIIDDEKK